MDTLAVKTTSQATYIAFSRDKTTNSMPRQTNSSLWWRSTKWRFWFALTDVCWFVYATQTRHVNVGGKYFLSWKLANTQHAWFVMQTSLFFYLSVDALRIRLNISSSWQHYTVCKMLLSYVHITHSPITRPCSSTGFRLLFKLHVTSCNRKAA